MVGHPGTVLDYGADHAGWDQVVPGDVPPLIAIPTTAGTGSEVGRSTVITCPVTEHKKVIFAPALLPKLALLDPVLTLSLPPHITAATGMDALSHCVESYLSPVFHPLCDSVALGGVRRIARALERAVLRGQEDLDARSEMLIAASMGAIAFQKELGATHALAHPLSTLCGVPHGTANGMLLARVMRYNLDVAEERLAEIAEALGVGRGMAAGSRAAAEAGCHFVEDLAARIGIPRTLSEVGVDPDMLDALAEKAFEDPCHQTNPRPCSRADLRALYAAAL
jgi:alcohol dehydrogenase class IV